MTVTFFGPLASSPILRIFCFCLASPFLSPALLRSASGRVHAVIHVFYTDIQTVQQQQQYQQQPKHHCSSSSSSRPETKNPSTRDSVAGCRRRVGALSSHTICARVVMRRSCHTFASLFGRMIGRGRPNERVVGSGARTACRDPEQLHHNDQPTDQVPLECPECPECHGNPARILVRG